MKGKILIIDDDESMRELLQLELSDEGYDVTLAESGLEGMQQIKDNQFQLVILDIRMPGMDGIEALEKIINTQRGLPVILHSAYSHFKENFRTWSATSYVVKSMDLTELKEAVHNNIKPEGA